MIIGKLSDFLRNFLSSHFSGKFWEKLPPDEQLENPHANSLIEFSSELEICPGVYLCLSCTCRSVDSDI